MTNKIQLGDVATLEIKEDRVVIKTSKSTLEIYKDGNIKVEDKTDKEEEGQAMKDIKKTVDIKIKLNTTINGKSVEEAKKILNDIIKLIEEFNNEAE